jgi:hypothetical protein
MKMLLVWLVLLSLLAGCSPRKFHHYDTRTGTHTFKRIQAYDREFIFTVQGELRITSDSIQFVATGRDAARRAELDSLTAVWSRSERKIRRSRRMITEEGQPLHELSGAYPTLFDLLGDHPDRFQVHSGPRIPFFNNYSVLRLRFRDSQHNFTIHHGRISVLQRIRKVLSGHWHDTVEAAGPP